MTCLFLYLLLTKLNLVRYLLPQFLTDLKQNSIKTLKENSNITFLISLPTSSNLSNTKFNAIILISKTYKYK